MFGVLILARYLLEGLHVARLPRLAYTCSYSILIILIMHMNVNTTAVSFAFQCYPLALSTASHHSVSLDLSRNVLGSESIKSFHFPRRQFSSDSKYFFVS